MDVRLIAIDLDGTLLREDRSPHPASVEAILRAQSAGVFVCLASGRMALSVIGFADEIGIHGPLVTSNGAYALDAQRNEIHHIGVRRSVQEKLIVYAHDAGCQLNIYARDRVMTTRQTEWGQLYCSRVRNLKVEIVDESLMMSVEPTKILIVDEPEAIQRHRALLGPVLGEEATLTISEPEYLEFLAPGVDKSYGLRAVCEREGIRREETAAIGDYLNDLEMIEWAGVSAAMANGADELKRAASRVVASNEEGGVAEFIDSLLGNLRQ